MSPLQAWRVLRARWQVLAAVWLVMVVAALAVGLLRPAKYTASASAVVDFKPDPISAMAFGGMPTPAFMATQVDIVRSERVSSGVLARLPAVTAASLRARWQAETDSEISFDSWLSAVLQKDVDVRPARDSSVIHIGATAPSPADAAALANAVLQSYIATALALRVEPAREYESFFGERAQAARQALESAQSKLSTFGQQAGIAASDERLDIENARLNELSSQLTALQAEVADSSSRQRQAEGQGAERLREVINHPLVSQLRAEVGRLEGQLGQLSLRLGDRHPQVQELQGQLAESRNQLQAETRRVAGSVAVADTINRRREAELRAALAAQRTEVQRMKTARDEALVLQRDVDSAQRAWDGIQQRLAQSRLESQSTQGQVNVLSRATPPLEASTPRLVLLLLLAAVLGSVAAVAAALMLELRDRRVRCGSEVAQTLSLPLLGVMPNARLKGA